MSPATGRFKHAGMVAEGEGRGGKREKGMKGGEEKGERGGGSTLSSSEFR